MPKLPNTLVILPYDPNLKTEFERIRDYLMEHIGAVFIRRPFANHFQSIL